MFEVWRTLCQEKSQKIAIKNGSFTVKSVGQKTVFVGRGWELEIRSGKFEFYELPTAVQEN